MLDGLHYKLLHLREAHEGDEGSQAGDGHHAVYLRQLPQHTQHRHLSQAHAGIPLADHPSTKCASQMHRGIRVETLFLCTSLPTEWLLQTEDRQKRSCNLEDWLAAPQGLQAFHALVQITHADLKPFG